MVRIFGAALVILGLIFQPLMAAVPDFMPIDMPDHSAMGGEQATLPPCHETAAEELAPESCTNCDSDCDDGTCSAICSPSTVAVLNQPLHNAKRFSQRRAVTVRGALVQALPSRIFHPPKHT